MQKLKNFFIMTICIWLVYSCGYTPIFSSKNIKFKIVEIQKRGDANIAELFAESIKKNQNNLDGLEKISLIIDASKNKTTLVKDQSGKILSYKLEIIIKANAKRISSNEIIISKELSAASNFDNKDRKKKLEISQLSLLQTIISAGLVFLLPAYLIELSLGYRISIHLPFILTLTYVVLFPGLASFIFWIKGISIIG